MFVYQKKTDLTQLNGSPPSHSNKLLVSISSRGHPVVVCGPLVFVILPTVFTVKYTGV